jgi:hypothetical protein
MVMYYLSSIKKVLTQKRKILKNDCLLCYSKTLCKGSLLQPFGGAEVEIDFKNAIFLTYIKRPKLI